MYGRSIRIIHMVRSSTQICDFRWTEFYFLLMKFCLGINNLTIEYKFMHKKLFVRFLAPYDKFEFSNFWFFSNLMTVHYLRRKTVAIGPTFRYLSCTPWTPFWCSQDIWTFIDGLMKKRNFYKKFDKKKFKS